MLFRPSSLALLKILALGSEDVDAGRLVGADAVITRLRGRQVADDDASGI